MQLTIIFKKVIRHFNSLNRKHREEKGNNISSLLKSALILIHASSSFALGQSLKIPVFPFDDKPPHVLTKVHKKCKRAKKYWDCIDRSEQKVTTSLDMDY